MKNLTYVTRGATLRVTHHATRYATWNTTRRTTRYATWRAVRVATEAALDWSLDSLEENLWRT